MFAVLSKTFSGGSVLLLAVILSTAPAQAQEDIRDLKLKDWAPRSMMATKATAVD